MMNFIEETFALKVVFKNNFYAIPVFVVPMPQPATATFTPGQQLARFCNKNGTGKIKG